MMAVKVGKDLMVKGLDQFYQKEFRFHPAELENQRRFSNRGMITWNRERLG